jgi:hypothetical protein
MIFFGTEKMIVFVRRKDLISQKNNHAAVQHFLLLEEKLANIGEVVAQGTVGGASTSLGITDQILVCK